ncbi:Branched-chain amino acid transport [uncultured delta proteobacterium]|uniref:Branched-chain amino acid transport n=1 Tax=uncultured delta proteobacterium TaxID=34034 RepID=A0A212JXY0_9DELT|nr:Branched-chain amino acid transport [uncultured delta proteobacterium]
MNDIIIYILVMAGVTYCIRALPLVLIRGEITNPFIRSFLYYVPFVTLSVMIFPAILNSTARVESAAVGAVAAVILALHKGSLIQVSLLACAAVFLVERVL